MVTFEKTRAKVRAPPDSLRPWPRNGMSIWADSMAHMRPCRVHITGAAGAGTTTLGRALAAHWAVPHADTDDYFWLPTSPPYVTKRDVPERLRLMNELFVPRDAWVLSGSLMGWGDPLIDQFDAVVFVSLNNEVRLDRLHAREANRYGDAIERGGARESAHRAFMDWAAGYEDTSFSDRGRTRRRHEQWLAQLRCPVLRVDSAHPLPELIAEITR